MPPPDSSFAPLDIGAVEYFQNDDGNIIATYRNTLIQVRWGALTDVTLAAIESASKSLLAKIPSGPIGGLLLVEQNATLSNGAMRAKQMRLMQRVLQNERAHCVMVSLVGGASGTLMRTFGRLLEAAHPRMAARATVAEATTWIEAHAPPRRAGEMNQLLTYLRSRKRS